MKVRFSDTRSERSLKRLVIKEIRRKIVRIMIRSFLALSRGLSVISRSRGLGMRTIGCAARLNEPLRVCHVITGPLCCGPQARWQGEAGRQHLLRCRSSTMTPHRLRRGALHLPTRRSAPKWACYYVTDPKPRRTTTGQGCFPRKYDLGIYLMKPVLYCRHPLNHPINPRAF